MVLSSFASLRSVRNSLRHTCTCRPGRVAESGWRARQPRWPHARTHRGWVGKEGKTILGLLTRVSLSRAEGDSTYLVAVHHVRRQQHVDTCLQHLLLVLCLHRSIQWVWE